MVSSKLTDVARSSVHWVLSYVDCHCLEAMIGIVFLAHRSLTYVMESHSETARQNKSYKDFPTANREI